MRVLHLSTHELEGGAARAANRLHQALCQAEVDSLMLVQSRTTASRRVVSPGSKFARGIAALRPTLDQLPLYLLDRAGVNAFSPGWLPDQLRSAIRQLKPDIVHLHWAAKGLIRFETLAALRLPVVWTLHDETAFTGGCFFAGDCLRFQEACGCCPQLASDHEGDLSRWVWERKRRSWKTHPNLLICPSRWMAGRAAGSSLFGARPTRVIPNGIDLTQYKPLDRVFARQALGLPPQAILVLFSGLKGAADPRKGFHFLAELFTRLRSVGDLPPVELLALGDFQPADFAGIPTRIYLPGRLNDDAALALAYSAADLFLCPSMIDNLPNTVMEALACGTPVAAFGAGGIPEMLDHQQTGWLSPVGDLEHLTTGVRWILSGTPRRLALGLQARQRAQRDYDIRLQARRMIDLYHELIADPQAVV